MWAYLGKWKRRASCCAGPAPSMVSPGTLVIQPPPSSTFSHEEPVTVDYGVIERLFFGGQGQYSDYDSAKKAIADRKAGYEAIGYSGPVPWVMRSARTGQFIESGS